MSLKLPEVRRICCSAKLLVNQRLAYVTGLSIPAPGFPAEMTDDEPEEPGYEVVPDRGVQRCALTLLR